MMKGIRHRTLELKGGLNMHIAEKGEEGAPVVLFIHGFPDTWYGWRHQIVGIADKGYHVVAVDLRGFGDSDVPNGVDNYTKMHVVGDLVALIDALKQQQVFVVGHDWGAVMAWGLASFRPEMVKGLVTLSVPYMPRHPTLKPIAALKAMYGKNYYIVRFQDPGVVEAEFARIGYQNALRILLTVPPPNPPILSEENPFGSEYSNKEHSLPAWLTQEDLDYYTKKFAKTGFTGPLSHYRCLDKNWELMAPWQGSKVVNVPVKFIIGDEDLVYTMLGNKEYIHNGEFKKNVPMLQDVIIIEGGGHFIQQERSQEITKHIYEFIKTV